MIGERPAAGEAVIEQAIRDKGLTAPRITSEHIDSQIAAYTYHVFTVARVTVCCMTLRNGYSVVGVSACASPENFDAEIGRQVAYADARDKIWPLEGYLLRERLNRGDQR